MQINNTTSPNFMALRIKPEAKVALLRAPKETFETICRIGEELKNTKYWHLSIGENLVPTVEDSYIGRYTEYFKAVQCGMNKEFFHIKTKSAISGTKGEEIYPIFKLKTPKEAEECTKNINEAKTSIESAAEVVKVLEKRSVELSNEENKLAKERSESLNMTSELMARFGV